MFALRIGVKRSHLGHLQVNRACVFPCLTIAARTIRIVFVLIKNPFYFGQRPRRKWRLSVCKSCCFKNNLCFECNAMKYWKLLWTSCWTSHFFFSKKLWKTIKSKEKKTHDELLCLTNVILGGVTPFALHLFYTSKATHSFLIFWF